MAHIEKILNVYPSAGNVLVAGGRQCVTGSVSSNQSNVKKVQIFGTHMSSMSNMIDET